MEKIKVCHIVSGLKAGGVESMILNYCSLLNKNKYDFHILYQHDPSNKNVKEFEEIGIKLHRISSKVKHPFKNFFETYNYLKKEKIDVVHCHMTLMNFIPLIAAKKLKIKNRICHSHNSDVRKKNHIAKIIEKILKSLCIKYSTTLVACGNDAGRYMYGNKNFIVLNNALNLSKYEFNSENRRIIRKKYNITDDVILVGHIGRFTEQKNHKFIVEIISSIIEKNSNIKFMLLGDGELREQIEQLVFDKNIQDNVIFTGIVPNTNEYYSAFDLFILPSVWEGLPVVAIEAQASGLPCLFSNNIDKKCIIDKNKSCMLQLIVDVWNSKILEIIKQKNDRKIDKVKFQKSGLDINEQVQVLDNLYSE